MTAITEYIDFAATHILITSWFLLCVGAAAQNSKRIDKLEAEIAELKQLLNNSFTTHAAVGFVTRWTQRVQRFVINRSYQVANFTQKHAPAVYKQLENVAKELNRDLPSIISKVRTEFNTRLAQTKAFLNNFLEKQAGVPKQYIEYATLGIIATVTLALISIVLTILSLIVSVLCCGCTKSRPVRKAKKTKSGNGPATAPTIGSNNHAVLEAPRK